MFQWWRRGRGRRRDRPRLRIVDVLQVGVAVLPVSFMVSGGIATIMGIQPFFDFLGIFIFFIAFQIMLFDLYFYLERHVGNVD